MADVIVTYSWDNEEHKEKIISFTDWLRQSGYDAQVDRKLSQEETAIDFKKMMHQAMTDYKNVIIVLSQGYKQKAESFTGGVGNEYSLVLKDLDKNPTKYILASFDGRGDDVCPLAFRERDIIDLNNSNEFDRLQRKLRDIPELEFSAVGALQELHTKEISPFQIKTPPQTSLVIKDLIVKGGSSSRQGGIYNSADFTIQAEIQNSGQVSISEYSIEIQIPKELIRKRHEFTIIGDYAIIREDFTQKLFKGQNKITKSQDANISASNIRKVINSSIIVKAQDETGETSRSFKATDIFLFRQDNGMEPVPLSIELFTGYP